MGACFAGAFVGLSRLAFGIGFVFAEGPRPKSFVTCAAVKVTEQNISVISTPVAPSHGGARRQGCALKSFVVAFEARGGMRLWRPAGAVSHCSARHLPGTRWASFGGRSLMGSAPPSLRGGQSPLSLCVFPLACRGFLSRWYCSIRRETWRNAATLLGPVRSSLSLVRPTGALDQTWFRFSQRCVRVDLRCGLRV